MSTSNDYKCSVKGKIKCVFQSKVILSKSGKRNDQLYKVVASENLSPDFLNSSKSDNINITEKFDGTCCLIAEYHGRPWLWARHDIKPNKPADKRFKAYQQSKNEYMLSNDNDQKYPDFKWDVENDFKEAPDDWIPASGLDKAVPDDIGHMVGWVPVDPSLRQHLWHLSTVHFNDGVGLFLKDSKDNNEPMRIEVDRLENYYGKTFELIGSNVNGNPYKLGTKKDPIHVLIQHGGFTMKDFPDVLENNVTHDGLVEWFNNKSDGNIEGIVWHHVDHGKMFKLHRHHLDLKWPVDNLRLFSKQVTIDMEKYECIGSSKNRLFEKLKYYHGSVVDSITELSVADGEKS